MIVRSLREGGIAKVYRSERRLLIGVGRRDITPPIGMRLMGYGLRTGPSIRVHDSLFATALILSDGTQNVAIVTLDVAIYCSPEVDEVRQSIGKLIGGTSRNVMIACSHTHSGPVTWDGLRALETGGSSLEANEIEYMLHLRSQVLAAVDEASTNLREGRMAAGKGQAGMSINRREKLPNGRVVIGHNPCGPVDHEVGVARFDDNDGRPIACVVNYACHPTVMGPQNLEVSADFPGVVRRVVEQNTNAMCLFLQGAGANVAARRSISDNFADLEDQGAILGLEAAKVFRSLRTRRILQTREIRESFGPQVIWTDHIEEEASIKYFGVLVRRVEFPLRPLPVFDDAQAELQRREVALRDMMATGQSGLPVTLARHQRDWAKRVLAEVRADRRHHTVSADLQVIRVNDLVLVGTPAEPFVEIGLALKAKSSVANTFPVGYANGYFSYLPWPDAYADGGYEVEEAWKRWLVAGPAPECAGIVADSGVDLINRTGVPENYPSSTA
jgi:neutral ceramidase